MNAYTLTDETRLDALYNAREAALAAWDATEYNRIDGQIRPILAAMRAEVRLSLRADPMLTVSVGA